MARTRAQDKAQGSDSKSVGTTETPQKRAHSETQAGRKNKDQRSSSKKRKTKDDHEDGEERIGNSDASQPGAQTSNAIVDRLLSQYGTIPLSKTALASPTKSSPETILALVLNAMLSSARISHELAARSTGCVIKAGYHKLETLEKSTWQERTEVLTEGGYTRYREKTATAFGELAEFVREKYDGDLNNILSRTSSSPPKIRTALKEIKGLGDVGVDIFFDTAQGVWPCLAPFIDPRSLKTAEEIGIGDDVEKLWETVGKDAMKMCRLSSALTEVRLEKKTAEFKD